MNSDSQLWNIGLLLLFNLLPKTHSIGQEKYFECYFGFPWLLFMRFLLLVGGLAYQDCPQ